MAENTKASTKTIYTMGMGSRQRQMATNMKEITKTTSLTGMESKYGKMVTDTRVTSKTIRCMDTESTELENSLYIYLLSVLVCKKNY